MRKIVSMFLVICLALSMVGCGNSKKIDGKRYKTIGLFEEKNPDIHYRVIVGNVVWSIILVETVVMPVYFVGFSIWEPVCPNEDYTPGVDY